MAARPAGVPYATYPLGLLAIPGIQAAINSDAHDAVYAAALSYAEALRGLEDKRSTWAVVKLYYSTFYSFRAFLLMDQIVPFFCKEFFLCDVTNGAVKKAGKSSHIWNWNSINGYKHLAGWYYSQESTAAYDKLRDLRDETNYKVGFADPAWRAPLTQVYAAGVQKAFRSYRDDTAFLYTYLDDHFAVAYPTKMTLEACDRYVKSGLTVTDEQAKHLQKVWPLKDKHPLA